jgi:23S rRNA pseudouridine2605 synthase
VEITLEENGRLTRYKTKECKIKIDKEDERRLEITLNEGKKREVRRIFETLGNRVVKLKRISIGGLKLDELGMKEGDYLILEKEFIKAGIGGSKL